MAQGKITSVSPYGPESEKFDQKTAPAAFPPKPVNVRNPTLAAFNQRDKKRQETAADKAAKRAAKKAALKVKRANQRARRAAQGERANGGKQSVR